MPADKVALLTAEHRREAKETANDLKGMLNDFIDEVRKLRRAVEDKK